MTVNPQVWHISNLKHLPCLVWCWDDVDDDDDEQFHLTKIRMVQGQRSAKSFK